MNVIPADYVSYQFSIKPGPISLPPGVGHTLSDRVEFLVERMTLIGFSAGYPMPYEGRAFVNIKKENGKPERIVLEDLAKRLGLNYAYNGVVSMRPASHFV